MYGEFDQIPSEIASSIPEINIENPGLTGTTTVDSIQTQRESATRIRNSIEESGTNLSSTRDRYGFRKQNNFVSLQEYNSWWAQYSSHCTRRKGKWENLLLKNGLSLNNDNPIRFPPRSDKLKRYIRKGIPAEWRGNAWWFLARGPEKLKNNLGVYDELVKATINLQSKDAEIIERDLHRTFPDNVHFKPETPSDEEPVLIQALRRVLRAFAVYTPAIGYCQSLNFIAGLLLIFMDEEKAFWMLVIITSRYLPGIHEINLEGVNVDQGVLILSLREFIPDVWEKIVGIDFDNPYGPSVPKKAKSNNDFLTKLPPITLCTSSWFMSMFIGILPIETTLRVWDCFFYEDSNFLFKISLSIFKLLEPKVLQLKDEMEIFQVIQNSPKSLIDPSEIFDLIFKKKFGFNHLTQDEVNRCKKYVSLKRSKARLNTEDDNVDVEFNRGLLSDDLWQPDLYGFKKNSLPGVHWNNNLSRRMKLVRRR
jgi:hypothetical protein